MMFFKSSQMLTNYLNSVLFSGPPSSPRCLSWSSWRRSCRHCRPWPRPSRPRYLQISTHGYLDIYRVFSKGRIEVGPSKSLISWTFPDVLYFIWPFNMGDFSFWYFWDIWLKKNWKISFSKKARFQGWLKLAYFLISIFLGFLSITPFKTIQI